MFTARYGMGSLNKTDYVSSLRCFSFQTANQRVLRMIQSISTAGPTSQHAWCADDCRDNEPRFAIRIKKVT
jgi:hypothetical protein